MGRVWRDYSLSIVLAALFLVSWALQTWTGWVEFVAEQQAHGQVAEAFGPGGYVWAWAQATFENWQSEFLQLLDLRRPDHVPGPPRQPRVQGHRRRDAGPARPHREAPGQPLPIGAGGGWLRSTGAGRTTRFLARR